MQINGYGEQFYAKFSTDTQNKAITSFSCQHAFQSNSFREDIHTQKRVQNGFYNTD